MAQVKAQGKRIGRPLGSKDSKKEKNIPYPILVDDKNVTKTYGVEAIPTIIFFDKKGNPRKTQVGFAPELEAAFDTFIDSLLNEE